MRIRFRFLNATRIGNSNSFSEGSHAKAWTAFNATQTTGFLRASGKI